MSEPGEINQHQLTEADTCRLYVTPSLIEVGWDQSPHVIAEQRTFTDGRIYIVGRQGKYIKLMRRFPANTKSNS